MQRNCMCKNHVKATHNPYAYAQFDDEKNPTHQKGLKAIKFAPNCIQFPARESLNKIKSEKKTAGAQNCRRSCNNSGPGNLNKLFSNPVYGVISAYLQAK